MCSNTSRANEYNGTFGGGPSKPNGINEVFETHKILQAFKCLSEIEKNRLYELILHDGQTVSGDDISKERLSDSYVSGNRLFRDSESKSENAVFGEPIFEESMQIFEDNISQNYLPEECMSEDDYIELLNERFKGHGKGCPRCSSTYIVKNGKNDNNKQRYRCNECRKTFSCTTNSPFMYTKKSVQHWTKYMVCMSLGLSIRASAGVVGIHRNTSFQWRHKILNALKATLKEELSGIVEIGETLINESFKGNHSKDEDFRMGRAPRKRGIKLAQYTSGTKVRVLCCMDRVENIFSAVSGRLRPDWQRLIGMLKDKIAAGSTICTDRNMAYVTFAKKLNLKLYKLSNFKEVEEGIYHIQNAHSFGAELKRFLIGFHGVATKYLNFYITWLKWRYLPRLSGQGSEVMDAFRLIMNCSARLRVCDFRFVSSMPRT